MEKLQENIEDGLELHSEEIYEVITAVPSWILRRGILLIFGVLSCLVLVSAFIQYPDVIKTSLKVNSLNAPKAVLVKQTGKLLNLLAPEGTIVKQHQPLAYMESTANHNDVLKLHDTLVQINEKLNASGIASGPLVKGLILGELQAAYQNFYQQYLQYLSAQQGGYYLERKKMLERDLKAIEKLRVQIILQQKIQEKEFANVEREFEAYKKLYLKKVISISEYRQQENKYLAGKYPLQQSVTTLLNNNTDYAAKKNEILEIEHTIEDERAKYVQSLRNMLIETETWMNQFVLRAPIAGKISYVGIVQENQTINAGQEVFIINPENTDFFGEIYIPQFNMGKLRIGQRTLVKMRSFPFEQFGLIRGKVNYVSDVAINDSLFIAKIGFERFENKDPSYKITLKNGMRADAEIITEESSLLQRFFRNITKMMNSN